MAVGKTSVAVEACVGCRKKVPSLARKTAVGIASLTAQSRAHIAYVRGRNEIIAYIAAATVC